jgi:hypothetical protein
MSLTVKAGVKGAGMWYVGSLKVHEPRMATYRQDYLHMRYLATSLFMQCLKLHSLLTFPTRMHRTFLVPSPRGLLGGYLQLPETCFHPTMPQQL